MRTLLQIRGSFVCLGLLLAVSVSAQSSHKVCVNAAERTIAVEAEGSASSQADVMYLLFAVQDSGPLASATLKQNFDHVNSLVAAAKAFGPPVSRVLAAAVEFGESDADGGLPVTSDILVTLDISDTNKLQAARLLMPKIMDAAARCHGTPKPATAGGG